MRLPILAKGEFPHAAGVVQVVDDDALDAVASQEIPEGGLLLDFDHYSDLTDEEVEQLRDMGILLPSDAAGWIHHMWRDGDKVWADVDLTPAGKEKVAGKEYRYTSPVFDYAGLQGLGGNRVRPLHVEKVGLTNEPRMRAIGSILSNRSTYALANRAFEIEADIKGADIMDIAKLAEILGCDATEEAILAAIDALKAEKPEEDVLENSAEEPKTEEEAKPEEEELENACEEEDKEKKELKNRAESAEAELEALKAKVAEDALNAKVAEELAKHPALQNREAGAAALKADFDAASAILSEIDRTASAVPAAGMTPEHLENRAGAEGASELTGIERIARALAK